MRQGKVVYDAESKPGETRGQRVRVYQLGQNLAVVQK